MSLDEKRKEYVKRISFVGSQEDFESMENFFDQVKRMFNIDLEMKKKRKDIPTRITLREESEPDIISYPRMARILGILKDALEEKIPSSDDSQIIPKRVGSLDWIFNDPTDTSSPESIRVLQSITDGVARPGLKSIPPARHYSGRDIKQEFESMFQGKIPDNMRDKGGIFGTLSPEWVYINTVDVHPLDKKWKNTKKFGIRELRELDKDITRGISAVPPNLGVIENSKGKKVKPTMAMVAVFRADVEFDMRQKIDVSRRAWDNFIRTVPDYLLSKELKKDRPKTVGDLLKVFFAYNVASYMKMNDATVRPIAPYASPILTEHISGSREEKPGEPKPKVYRDKILYSALVVGTGDYPLKTHDTMHLKETEIPGWR